MSTIVGTVTNIDSMDAGSRAGVVITQDDGRIAYVRLTLGGKDMLLDRLGAARAHQNPVSIEIEPLPPRLGSPLGEITAILPLAA